MTPQPLGRPLPLAANQPPDRFYAGGAKIARFRGLAQTDPDPHTPEDWVGSTSTLHDEPDLGLSRLPDGRLLRTAVEEDPRGWLGPEHVAVFGTDPGLLVKLLDAGQRLPVHVHPDAGFAERHLGLSHGKTEAWIVLDPTEVRVAFSRDVSEEELRRWAETQDVDGLLDAMRSLRVRRGDVVFVPAGLPHAIGEGAFLVELQEPTDLSIFIEWAGFALDGETEGHLGLGFETAYAAVDRSGWSAEAVEALRVADAETVGELLPGAEGFFRAERARGPVRWEPGFAVLVVVSGSGELIGADEHVVPLRAGQTFVIPHAAGACRIETADPAFEALRCRPPRP